MFITAVCVLLLIKRKDADELKEIWTTNIKFLLLFAYWQLQILPKYYISGLLKVCCLELAKDNGKA